MKYKLVIILSLLQRTLVTIGSRRAHPYLVEINGPRVKMEIIIQSSYI